MQYSGAGGYRAHFVPQIICVRTADVSAEERRRIWRVLDRSAFSFSSPPLPREAVE